jgi:flagellar hook-associated protein 2
MTASGSSSQFRAFTAASSLPAVLTASASSGASAGSHTIQVSQLARGDALVSARFTASGTTIVDAEMTADEKAAGSAVRQFQLTQNGTSVGTVSVTLKAGDTNDTVLSKVASAINNTSGVSGAIGASLVSISATQRKLVLTSKATGTDHAIGLSNASGALLDNLGWTAGVLGGRTAPSSSTTPDDPTHATGGYLYGSADNLDAMFTVDGIDVRRGSNAVSDVLSGVTLNLLSAQKVADSPVTITVGSDQDTIRANVKQFMTDYNDAVDFLNQKTTVDRTTGKGSILSGDLTFLTLRVSLRQQVYGLVSSVSPGSPALLADIGITLDAEGKLSISDETKFTAAIAGDTSNLETLFTSSNGVATRLRSFLTSATGTTGSVQSRQDSINSQLTSLQAQLKRMNDRVTKQVDKFRTEFAQAQALAAQLQSQQQLLSYILSSTSSG